MKYIMFVVAFMFSIDTDLNNVQEFAKKASGPAKPQVPKVVLVYPENGTPFDRNCGTFLNKPIKTEWVQETAKRLNEFQALWNKEGPEYVKTALEEVGGPYPYQEVQATLTVCSIPPMSSPLIMNVRNFLSTAEKPLPPDAFVEILFHELMHTYTRPVYNKSPLRKKYATESPVVLNHLHLMALEKFVLQKLGKTEFLNLLDSGYLIGEPPRHHERAWDIVHKIEGHEAFIDELKLVYRKDK